MSKIYFVRAGEAALTYFLISEIKRFKYKACDAGKTAVY